MNIPLLLQRLYPVSAWSLDGDDYDGLTWLSDGPAPSREELEAAWPQVAIEVAWDEVRAKRDGLLAASDWTQVGDAPVDSSAWAAYRQALRDVPQDYTTPEDVVWPIAPA